MMHRDDDPYESLANPTMQARRLMDERGIRRHSGAHSDEDDDEASARRGARGYAEEQEKRIESLENELGDTKRLLMDVLYDKQQLERDKLELQRLVEELSGGDLSGAHNNAGKNDPVADRAKATILALRLKRTEQKRSQFIDFAKTTARTALTATRRLRTTTTELRNEIQEQFERMQEQLTDSVSDFESMVDGVNRRMMGYGGSGGGGGTSSEDLSLLGEGGAFAAVGGASAEGGAAGYAGLVAAAVQQQQRSTILAADHPLVLRLGVLYNTIDAMVDVANASWREMRCFAAGTAPQLPRPRRYIDGMANVNNYIAQAERVRRGIAYTFTAQRLQGDLRLPCAMRHSVSLVAQAHDALARRVEDLFDATRTIRTSVVVKSRNLTTAFRVFAACEAVQQDASRIYTTYLKLSKQHVLATLRYLARLLRFGRMKLTDFEFADPKVNTLEVGQCPCCAAPVACEDCYRVLGTKHAALRLGYEKHRKAVGDFTLARLEHFKRLRGLIDESIKILTVARLVPLEREAGSAAANDAVDTMIRKPQPPSSINYFTRQRKSEGNRAAIANGGMPDDSAVGLGVRPPTLDERRVQLLRMVAETDLRHLPARQFPPDELARAAGYDEVVGAAEDFGGAYFGGGAITPGRPGTMEGTVGVQSARALPSVRLAGSVATRASTAATGTAIASAAAALMGGGGGAFTARGGSRRPRGALRADDYTAARSGRLVVDHLPDLAGPREAEATLRHADRLDAARRHHAHLAAAEAPRTRTGGGGPSSHRSMGSDGRLGFSTSSGPRTLTERMLGAAAL